MFLDIRKRLSLTRNVASKRRALPFQTPAGSLILGKPAAVAGAISDALEVSKDPTSTNIMAIGNLQTVDEPCAGKSGGSR